MKIEMLYAESNIEHILVEEINEKFAKWNSEHPNTEIVSVDQKITFVPDIGCPNILLTLVIVYRESPR